jgi:hypothetical protein
MPTAKSKSTATTELAVNPFAFEVFQLASKQRSKTKKVEVLKKYEHASLKSLLIWNFDESLVSVLPPGEVPYASVGEQNSFSGNISEKINDAVGMMDELGSNSLGSQDQGRSSIRKEFEKFYNFIRGGNDSRSSLRRETMFINVLQGLHPLEAEIVCLVKDKKLQSKYRITKAVVDSAFPTINWGGRSK